MLITLLLEKFYFGHTTQLAGSQFPDQGLNSLMAVKVLNPNP